MSSPSLDSATAKPLLTFTRSKKWDAVLIVVLLLLLMRLSPRLRVYYRVTMMDVRLVQIAPDGARRALPTPREFVRPRAANGTPEVAAKRLVGDIRSFMRRDAAWKRVAEGTRYEWTIRYSPNSTRLNQKRTLIFDK